MAKLKTYYRRSLKGLKKIFTNGRTALITGLLASFGFLVVSGFLDLFPQGLTATAKIIVGVVGIVILGLIGLKG